MSKHPSLPSQMDLAIPSRAKLWPYPLVDPDRWAVERQQKTLEQLENGDREVAARGV